MSAREPQRPVPEKLSFSWRPGRAPRGEFVFRDFVHDPGPDFAAGRVRTEHHPMVPVVCGEKAAIVAGPFSDGQIWGWEGPGLSELDKAQIEGVAYRMEAERARENEHGAVEALLERADKDANAFYMMTMLFGEGWGGKIDSWEKIRDAILAERAQRGAP